MMTTVKKRTTLITAIAALVVAVVIACSLTAIPVARADEVQPQKVDLTYSAYAAAYNQGGNSLTADSTNNTLTLTETQTETLFGATHAQHGWRDATGQSLDGFSFDMEISGLTDEEIIGVGFNKDLWGKTNAFNFLMVNNDNSGELYVSTGGAPGAQQASCIGYMSPELCEPYLGRPVGKDGGFTLTDDSTSEFIPFSSPNIKLNFRFARYSTYRYAVTITALTGDFGSTLKGVTDKAYTFYIYTPDVPDMFDKDQQQTFDICTHIQCDGQDSAVLVVSNGLNYGKNNEIIDDGILLPEEVMPTETIVPQTGNYLVDTDGNWAQPIGNVIARTNGNDSTWIGCDSTKAQGWGTRIGYGEELTLNGLSITADYRQLKVGSFFGIIFGNTGSPYYGADQGSGLVIAVRMDGDSDVRVFVQANHDLNNAAYRRGYRSIEEAKTCTDKNKQLPHVRFLSPKATNGGPTATPKFRYTFNKVENESDLMSLKIECLSEDTKSDYINAQWESEAGWSSNFAPTNATEVTVYIKLSEIMGTDDDGEPESLLFNSNEHTFISVAPDSSQTQGMMIMHIEQPESSKIDADDVEVTLAEDNITWTGSAITPEVSSVKVGDDTIPSTGYRVSYRNNVNAGTEAVVAINFIGDYVGSVQKNFTIVGIDASSATVTFPKESYAYTGAALKPQPTVKLGDVTIPNTSFTTVYSNNTNAGEATLTINFKGGYTGSKTAHFTITKIATAGTKADVAATAGCTLASVTTDKYGAGTYTVKKGDETVTAETLSVGTYTVTLVTEETNTITTSTYTVTVSEAQVSGGDGTGDNENQGGDNQGGDNGGSSEESSGCGSSLGATSLVLGSVLLVCSAVVLFAKKRENN